MLSYVCLLTTPWTVAHQAFLLMEFPRREYWSGLPLPLSGDLPNSGIEPLSPGSLLHWRQILYCWATGEAPDLSDAISSYLYFHLTTMNLMNLLLLWVVISSFCILWFFFPSSCSELWCARITSKPCRVHKLQLYLPCASMSPGPVRLPLFSWSAYSNPFIPLTINWKIMTFRKDISQNRGNPCIWTRC